MLKLVLVFANASLIYQIWHWRAERDIIVGLLQFLMQILEPLEPIRVTNKVSLIDFKLGIGSGKGALQKNTWTIICWILYISINCDFYFSISLNQHQIGYIYGIEVCIFLSNEQEHLKHLVVYNRWVIA